MGKKIKGRNYFYKRLREENTTEEHIDERGNSVYLNLAKRIFFDKPYKNEEYERERMRMIRKIEMKYRNKEEGER